ncbi:MAG: N-acetyl-gamma-glutamyl-phosphate reductase [Sarcina sp.]
MIKVGIIGATGYVGVELLRLLLNHNVTKIVGISSKSFKGKNFSEVYEGFYGITDLICEDEDLIIERSDVVFTAIPHGLSEKLAEKILAKNKILIDMGADFRLRNEEDYKLWYNKEFLNKPLHSQSIYSIPELHRKKFLTGDFKIIANPGCYPTSIALGLAPALKANLVKENSIIIDSKSGLTGAGRNVNLLNHYVECNESMNAYSLGGIHRHTPEIEQVLGEFSKKKIQVTFTPHLIPINRGILSTIYFDLKDDKSLDEIYLIYKKFYKKDFFVKVLPLGSNAKIKNVKNSNYCNISIHKDERCKRIIVCSVIDNMVKGAAGQAIQNMNLLFGLEENLGLKTVGTVF